MLNEVNNNAQSIALNAAISTEETTAEQALNELNPIFMQSIEEQNSAAASPKSESMLKSMCKPRVLIPLAAVTTGTALAILAYQYGMIEKIWPKDPEPVQTTFQWITGMIANPVKGSEFLANAALGAMEQVGNAKEYVVQNSGRMAKAGAIGVISGGLLYGAIVVKAVALNAIGAAFLPGFDFNSISL